MRNNDSLKKIFLIVKREYIKVVRKKTFWLSTIIVPIFIGLLTFISGYTSMEAEKMFQYDLDEIEKIAIIDEFGVISDSMYQDEKVIKVEKDEQDEYIDKVRLQEIDALILYEQDIVNSGKIKVWSSDDGIVSRDKFNSIAESILKGSIIADIGDPNKTILLQRAFTYEVIAYNDEGELTETTLMDLVVPGIFVVVYFMLMAFALNYLLTSITEEKENRMIEIIMTIVRPRDLVIGKIISQVLIASTQLLVVLGLSIAVLFSASKDLNIPFDAISVSLPEVFIYSLYTILGFSFLSSVTVAVGVIMPTQKEAQSFFGFFMFLTMLPLYFITLIVADPMGLVSTVTSFVPFISSMVMMMRNALVVVPLWQNLLAIGILLAFNYFTYWLASVLFKVGAMQYGERVNVWKTLKRVKTAMR